jgi:Spy/CpxP family protein refolding chaperone
MKGYQGLLPILLCLLSPAVLWGQARGTEPVDDLAVLQQVKTQLDRVQQMDQAVRVSMYRELERVFARLQQSPSQAASASRDDNSPRRVRVQSNALTGGLDVQVGGAWWTEASVIARLGLSDDQKTKIERAFENHRLTLISNRTTLEKEEAQLTQLINTERLDRNAVSGQILRVVNARAEMERTNAAMMLEMREQLTMTQWAQLQALPPSVLSVTVPYSTVPVGGPAGARGAPVPGQRGGGERR